MREYILRSYDQGKTWTVVPGKRPGGWYEPKGSQVLASVVPRSGYSGKPWAWSWTWSAHGVCGLH